MVNTKAIKKRMIDLDVETKDLAKAIGKQPVTVRQKISNYRPLFLHEAEAFQKVLQIEDEEFCYYFCNHESRSVTNV